MGRASFDGASAVLLGYGAANIAGNLLAGRFYSERSGRWKAVLPAALGAGYLLLFAAGNAAFAAGAVILLLGVLAGFASVAGQSMITSAAPEAPDFANGLFLTAANFGTMAGTAFCGLFITLAGTRFSLSSSSSPRPLLSFFAPALHRPLFQNRCDRKISLSDSEGEFLIVLQRMTRTGGYPVIINGIDSLK